MTTRRTGTRKASDTGQAPSRSAVSQAAKRTDRRIQKTRASLHEALGALIVEKPYDAITVKDILDRADVGRSTFYTHFGDKDDLLVWGMRDMLAGVRAPQTRPRTRRERVTWFSRAIFEHIGAHRPGAKTAGGAKARALIHERLQDAVTELIADTVRREFRSERLSCDLLVHYLGSTFVLVLNWWLEQRDPRPASDAEDLFQTLVGPTLTAL